MREKIPQKLKCSILSPWLIFAIGIMFLNDHFFKWSGILPSGITGKLSDFAFIFFLPIVVAYVFRVKSAVGLALSYASVGLLFAAINLNAVFSHWVESLFSMAFIPLKLWPDGTDLVALTMLPLSAWFLLKSRPNRIPGGHRWMQVSVIFFCFITCVATSPRHGHDISQRSMYSSHGHMYNPGPSHEPIYMPWGEFRSSAKVMPPRDIIKRGKIYIKGNHLYVNDPYTGIHVFDNTDPKNPIAKCFIYIPGNTDISIKGSYLYADSYVDLLVFTLTMEPEDSFLVNRMKNIFPYTSHLHYHLPRNSTKLIGKDADIDKSKGVVTGWKIIPPRSFDDGGSGEVVLYGKAAAVGGAVASSAPRPSMAGGSSTGGKGGSMARFTLKGNYLYTVSDSLLSIFHLRKSSHPKRVKAIKIGTGIETIFPYKDLLFFGTRTGMMIYNVAEPENPVFYSRYDHIYSCDPVVVENGYAYVTLRSESGCQFGQNELQIYDIVDPHSPILLKTYPMQNPLGLGIDGNKLFICDGMYGLKVYDVTNREDVQLIETFSDINGYDVIPAKPVLIVSAKDGIYQFDYSRGKTLIKLSRIPVGY